MVQILTLLRLWAQRLLWMLVAGAVTVLVAFLPEGLEYSDEVVRPRFEAVQERNPTEPFLIQSWEELTGDERAWHWSPTKFGSVVAAFGKDLLNGELQYTVPHINPALSRSYPIMPRITEAWHKSGGIFAAALVGGVLTGLLVGSLVVVGRWVRILSLSISVGFMAIPEFLVILVGQVATIWTFNHLGFRLWTVGVSGGERHWLLPLLALSILPIGYTARLMAGALDEIMPQDYIRTARAKGIPEWRVILGHAWRNALPRVLNGLPTIVNATLSSLVIVELLTSWPGIGRLLQPPPEESVLMASRMFGQPQVYGQPILLATGGLVFCIWFILLNGLAHTIRVLVSPQLREVEE